MLCYVAPYRLMTKVSPIYSKKSNRACIGKLSQVKPTHIYFDVLAWREYKDVSVGIVVVVVSL